MRVIKFRAWDKVRKQFVPQGEFVFYEYGDTRFEVMPNSLEYAYIEHKQEDFEITQFTGLHDKGLKESYVGDILKETLTNGEERYYKIFEVEGGFAINTFQDDFYKPIEQIQFWTALSDMQTISWFKSSLEVVGNIYQHPELLNKN